MEEEKLFEKIKGKYFNLGYTECGELRIIRIDKYTQFSGIDIFIWSDDEEETQININKFIGEYIHELDLPNFNEDYNIYDDEIYEDSYILECLCEYLEHKEISEDEIKELINKDINKLLKKN